MTRSTRTPWAANQATARARNHGPGDGREPEAAQPQAPQDTPHGGAGQPEAPGNGRAGALLGTQRGDGRDEPRGGAMVNPLRRRGAIVQSGEPRRGMPGPPLVDGPRTHPEGRRRLRHTPAVHFDPLHDQGSALRGRLCVTMHPHPGSSSWVRNSWGTNSLLQEAPDVNNVLGRYT